MSEFTKVCNQVLDLITLPEHKNSGLNEREISERLALPMDLMEAITAEFLEHRLIFVTVSEPGYHNYHVEPRAYAFKLKGGFRDKELPELNNSTITVKGDNYGAIIPQSGFRDLAFKPTHNPPNAPITAEAKQGRMKSIIAFIRDKIVIVIITAVVGGLVLAYLKGCLGIHQ
jgi:hypothetical protein